MILRGLCAILGRALLPVRELAADCVHWPEVVKEALRGIVYLARDEVCEVAVGNDLGRDVSRAVGGRHKGWRDALLEERDPIEAAVPVKAYCCCCYCCCYCYCYCYYCY